MRDVTPEQIARATELEQSLKATQVQRVKNQNPARERTYLLFAVYLKQLQELNPPCTKPNPPQSSEQQRRSLKARFLRGALHS